MKLTLKNLISGSPTPDSSILSLVDNLRNSFVENGGPVVSKESARGAFALEGMAPDAQLELKTSIQNLKNIVTQSGAATQVKYTIAQEEAGINAAIQCADVRGYLAQPVIGLSQLQAFANENTVVIGNPASTAALTTRPHALEAYDEKENKQAMTYSVAYNLRGARQDEFGEAFFPTTIVEPGNVGFMVSIRLLYVVNEVQRQLNGDLNKFNRQNVIRAAIDHRILKNDLTAIIPVYRKATPAAPDTDTFQYFSTLVGQIDVVQGNDTFKTAPLAFGKSLSLLGISQPPALIAGGQLDGTDALDSSVRLKAIYVRLTKDVSGTITNEVFRFPVDKLVSSDFNAAVQGNTRMLNLNFRTEELLFKAGTLKADGTASTLLAGLSTNVVRIKTSVVGSVVQDTADLELNAGAVSVSRVIDANGNVLSQATGAGQVAATAFVGATLEGYDIMANKVNSNRRQRGKLIDQQTLNYLYTVPLLSPFTALRPVNASDSDDGALLTNLVQVTYQATSNAAVTAILEHVAFLDTFVPSWDGSMTVPSVLGVASALVKPSFLKEAFNVATHLDSLNSTDRRGDLSALLLNKIRDVATRLYVDSGYKAAANSVYDGAPPKPLLIIGCDPRVASYLTIPGDTRTMGDQFDVKIVETLDDRFVGQVVFSFGSTASYNSGVPNPLHFGTLAWKPEMTLAMPTMRGGANSMELTVAPSYRHIVNLPVAGQLIVSGIEDVIARKVTINTSN